MSTTAERAPARNVVPLRPSSDGDRHRGDSALRLLVPIVVAGFALFALDGGLYDYGRWGALAGVMLAIVSGLLIAGRIGTFGRLGPTVLTLAALTAWTALSILWADSPDRAWTESDRLVLYGAVFVICVVTLRTSRDVHHGLAAVGAVIAATALYTAVALLRGDPGAFLDHRLNMPIGYVNGAAALFLMGLWPLVSVAERVARPVVAGAAVAVAVLEANLLVLTQSRAIVPAALVSACVLLALFPGRIARAWTLLLVAGAVAAATPWTLAIYADRIPHRPRAVAPDLAQQAAVAAIVTALLAGLTWGIVAGLRRSRSSARARRLAAIVAVATAVGGGAALLVATGDPVNRAQQQWHAFTMLDRRETAPTRFTGAGGFRYDLWRVAIEDVRREPVHGVGGGSYGLSYYQQRRQEESIRQPHSLPLQILAELGLVGGVLALIAVATAAVAVIRGRREDVAAGVAGTGMVMSWATQTSFDWLHNLPGITCIALLGLVAANGATPFAPLGDLRRRRIVLIAGALLVALAAASFGRHYSSHVYAERARDALPRNPTAALRAAGAALELNPYAVDTRYTQAAAYARLDDYPRARDALMRAAAREPLNFVPWALLGDLAARRREIGHARAAYGRASRLNPRDTQLRQLSVDPSRALP